MAKAARVSGCPEHAAREKHGRTATPCPGGLLAEGARRRSPVAGGVVLLGDERMHREMSPKVGNPTLRSSSNKECWQALHHLPQKRDPPAVVGLPTGIAQEIAGTHGSRVSA